MAIELSGSEVRANGTGTHTSVGVSVTGVSAGMLLIARVHTRIATQISNVTDGIDGDWTEAVEREDTVNSFRVAIWYKANASEGDRTVTATFGSTNGSHIGVSKWTGAATSSVVEATADGQNNMVTSHPAGATGVTTTGADLLFSAGSLVNYGTTKTVGDDDGTWTSLGQTDTSDRWFGQYLITTGAVSGNLGAFSTNANNSSAVVVAAFNEASATGLSASVAEQQLVGSTF